ncbi:MAG TPA: hypothetical protein VH592_04815 [Gemmataceae bacterium]|jgi:hypothetical protein
MKPQVSKLRRWVAVLIVVLIVGGLIGYTAWYELLREEPQHFDTPEEQFLYGSIGTEKEEGLPYWVWLVLPRVFPEYLPGPGGYTSLGIVWEEGHETPVGFSKKTIGFPRIGINCALCHSGSYRTDPQQYPIVVAGAPANRLDLLGYQRFLFACASDPRFTADEILPVIEYNTKLSFLDKLLYRFALIPRTRDGLLQTKQRFAWTETRPDWGRGRIDPFNPVKFHQLGMDPSKDSSIGNSDMEPLWNRAERKGHLLHWDGLNDSLTEVVLSGAIGDGATAKSLPYDDLGRMQDWLQNLPAPKYPYSIDTKLTKDGERIFREAKCAECHAFGGARTGQVISVEEVGTDSHRLGMWSQEAADIYNRYPPNASWKFQHFQKHNGYVAVPLDGLWLRAPYLHNGSVPTLEDLFKPVKDRTKVFYRGYDLYDRNLTGFIHQGSEAMPVGSRYDTAVEGNSNIGHTYGTDLKDDEKKALVEYLKTL